MSNKKAFVLMPFAEELADVYQFLIADGLTRVGYIVKRADDIKSQGNILSDIIEGIVSSDLIVADLTGANPNVYYELGIAHALNKKVILLTQDIEELPFDLRSYRVVSYSLHFTKMNKAKNELSELASEAFNGKLPFGNPVKDFGRVTMGNLNVSLLGLNDVVEDQENDFGLLDYRMKLEDGFKDLGEIVVNVGSKLENEVNPEIVKTGEKLKSGQYTTAQQRNIVIELATHMQRYGEFVKPNNEKYRIFLKDIESSLEFILGGKVELSKESEADLIGFLEVLSGVEQSAFEGRQSFASLIEVMDSLPKIEKSFNKAKAFMAGELREFVTNIDQTISVISRAGRLGKSLIEKVNQKQIT